MVNSNHDPLHTVVRFCDSDEDDEEIMVIDGEKEDEIWERKCDEFWRKCENEWKLVLILLESVYICVVKI